MPTVLNDAEENPGHIKGVLIVDVWLLDPNEGTTKVFHKTLKNAEEEPLSIFVPPRVCLFDNMGRVIFRGLDNFRPNNEGTNTASKIRPIDGQMAIKGQKRVPPSQNSEETRPPMAPVAFAEQGHITNTKTIDKFTNLAGKSPEKKPGDPALSFQDSVFGTQTAVTGPLFPGIAPLNKPQVPSLGTPGSGYPPFLKPPTVFPTNMFAENKAAFGQVGLTVPSDGQGQKDKSGSGLVDLSLNSNAGITKPFPEPVKPTFDDLSIHSKSGNQKIFQGSEAGVSESQNKGDSKNFSKNLSLYSHQSKLQGVPESGEEAQEESESPDSPLHFRPKPKVVSNPSLGDLQTLLTKSLDARKEYDRSGIIECEVDIDFFKNSSQKLVKQSAKIVAEIDQVERELHVMEKMNLICESSIIDKQLGILERGKSNPLVQAVEAELHRLLNKCQGG